MEDNRFIFILGGLSGTDTLSLGSHGLPFTHWYSNSNNKPCLLRHIMKVKGGRYKVPSTVSGTQSSLNQWQFFNTSEDYYCYLLIFVFLLKGFKGIG